MVLTPGLVRTAPGPTASKGRRVEQQLLHVHGAACGAGFVQLTTHDCLAGVALTGLGCSRMAREGTFPARG